MASLKRGLRSTLMHFERPFDPMSAARGSRLPLALAAVLCCCVAFVGPTTGRTALRAVPELLSLAETGDEGLAAEARAVLRKGKGSRGAENEGK